MRRWADGRLPWLLSRILTADTSFRNSGNSVSTLLWPKLDRSSELNFASASRQRDTDALEIGRQSGARYVVQGSVRRNAGDVRVDARMSDAETGLPVWADQFDGKWSPTCSPSSGDALSPHRSRDRTRARQYRGPSRLELRGCSADVQGIWSSAATAISTARVPWKVSATARAFFEPSVAAGRPPSGSARGTGADAYLRHDVPLER